MARRLNLLQTNSRDWKSFGSNVPPRLACKVQIVNVKLQTFTLLIDKKPYLIFQQLELTSFPLWFPTLTTHITISEWRHLTVLLHAVWVAIQASHSPVWSSQRQTDHQKRRDSHRWNQIEHFSWGLQITMQSNNGKVFPAPAHSESFSLILDGMLSTSIWS